jgi:hypothetical protein
LSSGGFLPEACRSRIVTGVSAQARNGRLNPKSAGFYADWMVVTA